jgi:putative flippase GtrA
MKAAIEHGRVVKMIRFLISGLTAFVLNIGIYSLLIYRFGLWYIFASVAAFVLAFGFSFFLQKTFAFREMSKERTGRQFAAYASLVVFNLCANTLILFLLVSEFHVNRILGAVLSNGIVAGWSFFLYEKVIFRSTIELANLPEHTGPPHSRPRVSVVIPCFNEEASIGAVLAAVPRDVFEIIVVDNNCTDRTAEIARAAGARIVPEKIKGYGAALKAGFLAAHGDVIASFDGDNQYPASEVWPIVDALVMRRLDFISATRFPLDNKDAMSAVRKVGNWGLTFGVNILFDLSLTDSQSGMWVFKRSVLDHITLNSNDMPLSQELKIKVARDPGVRFAEYHIPYNPRLGTSKLFPLKHGLMLLWHMTALRAGVKTE